MNLIYIFADQWRRDAIGFYDSNVRTPRIDDFAKSSTVFDRAYSSCPLCSPARASLISGLQPNKTGVFTNCKPDVNSFLGEDKHCITDVIKENGYKTGYIGKWHLDYPDGSGGWDAYTPKGKKRHGFDFWYSYGACDEHTTPHYWNTEGERIQVNEWSTYHETDVALDFIEKSKNDDFVLFLSYNPPHSPYDITPKEYTDIYKDFRRTIKATTPAPEGRGDAFSEKLKGQDFDEAVTRGYYGAVSAMDTCIGRIVDYLKENNLYDDTYILISADHGDMLGDHERLAKHIWYEGSVSIPLIVGGGKIEHRRCEEMVSTVDQSATILGLLGINPKGMYEGVDFSPLLKDNTPVHQESVMTSAFPNTGKIIEEFKSHGKNYMDYGWRSIVTHDYKLAVDKGHSYGYEPKKYLYSLKDNFYENESIDNKEVMDYMTKELKYWLEKNDDHFLDDLDIESI